VNQPARRRSAPRGRPTQKSGSGLATVALATVTAVAVAGMARLFRGETFLWPLLAAVAAAHVASWTGRRLGAPGFLSALASFAFAGLVGVWMIVPATTAWGLPTLETIHRIASDLATAKTDFSLLHAPVPATAGFLLVALSSVGVIATVSDWAAFRLGLGVEAVLPSFALVVFTDALGTNGGRVLATSAYALAVMGFALAESAGRLTATTRWIGGAAETGRAGLIGRGAQLGAVAVLVGAVLGPALPGADAAPLVRWHNNATIGAGVRTTVSPLVDVRATEVDEARNELFTVKAAQPSYWRLTALDHFDGNVWSADQRYRPAGGYLAPTQPPRSTPLAQRVKIASLSEAWLPAAYQAKRVDLAGSAIDTSSSSLIAASDTTTGMRYDVVSAVPDPTAAQLEQVSQSDIESGLAGDYRRMVQLPNLPGQIARLAKSLVAGAPTPYDKAMALQSYLRSGLFTYRLSVPAGHDTDALVNFLFDTRTGFCEQFASAYAVLARLVDLPTRVAVGFTWGELRGGVYHVYGTHAHAWPEVYLGARYGWVPFEPTPGRGQPDATAWTGVTQAQAQVRDPSTPGAAATGPAAPSRPGPGNSALPGAGLRGLLATGGGSSRVTESGGPNGLLVALLVAAGLATSWIGGLPLLRRARRARRRRRAGDNAERVLVAWSEACEDLAARGVVRRDAETLVEYADRASGSRLGPEGATWMAKLAGTTAMAAYSSEQVTTETLQQAEAAAKWVASDLASSVSGFRRLLVALGARPLLPPEWRTRNGEKTEEASRHKTRSPGGATSRRA
jgi:transglutaminase-like putative cysteine protease